MELSPLGLDNRSYILEMYFWKITKKAPHVATYYIEVPENDIITIRP